VGDPQHLISLVFRKGFVIVNKLLRIRRAGRKGRVGIQAPVMIPKNGENWLTVALACRQQVVEQKPVSILMVLVVFG
jgi:hypothetical protein